MPIEVEIIRQNNSILKKIDKSYDQQIFIRHV